MKHFLANDWDRTQAIQRGGNYQFVPLDQKTAEAIYDTGGASDLTAERLFDSRWAKTLAGRSLNSLKDELRAKDKAELFEQLKTFLAGDSGWMMKHRHAPAFRERQSKRKCIGLVA